jgi:cytidylate kinase
MTVAIDGPAGTGKSSVARCIAEKTGFLYLNSGLFYRAITWASLDRGIPLDDPESVADAANPLQLDLHDDGILINGEFVGGILRSAAVDSAVASVSSIPEVRKIVNARLHELAATHDLVAEGRDMTTVVFPDAEVKVYLDASIDARARRRHDESSGTQTLDEIRTSIAERDRIDKNKRVGRLKVDPAALYINSSDLTLNQVCDIVLRAILRKNQDNRSN